MLMAIACSAPPTEPASAAPASATTEEAMPADGRPLFSFLLRKIPDLAMKVPCSCCQYRIGQCYQGACPTTCGPCNQIGRDVYTWHREGLGDEEILARVAAKYPHR